MEFYMILRKNGEIIYEGNEYDSMRQLVPSSWSSDKYTLSGTGIDIVRGEVKLWHINDVDAYFSNKIVGGGKRSSVEEVLMPVADLGALLNKVDGGVKVCICNVGLGEMTRQI